MKSRARTGAVPWPPCPVSVPAKSVLGPVSSHSTAESWPLREALTTTSKVGGGPAGEGDAAGATPAFRLGNTGAAEGVGMGD